jgi:Fic family protein
MKKKYIWEDSRWPFLTWDRQELLPLLGEVRNLQGRLSGKISLAGEDVKKRFQLNTLVAEVIANTRMENCCDCDEEQLRIALKTLLFSKKNQTTPDLDHHNNLPLAIATVLTEASTNCKQAITAPRLNNWVQTLNGDSFSVTDASLTSISLNTSYHDPNNLFNKINYTKQLPTPENADSELTAFIAYVNLNQPADPVVKAGVSYLRLLLIQPFQRFNEIIARMIATLFLAKAERQHRLYYSLTEQTLKEQHAYKRILDYTLFGSADITEWMRWFLQCVRNALAVAEEKLNNELTKSHIYELLLNTSLNERQLTMVNSWLANTNCGLITTSQYAAQANCSSDTALRDLQYLISKKIIVCRKEKGRNASYTLAV